MSFSIEYNRKLYKHPAFSAGDGDIYYILLVKRGDSNVYTTERRRVREWYLAFYGDESQFWQYVGEPGGYCEGGELQRVIGWSGSRWCHIEEYIELYRKVFRHAKPLESILDDFNIFLNIELTGNEMIPMLISDIRNSAKQQELKSFLFESSKKPDIVNIYGCKASSARVPVKDVRMFLRGISLKGQIESTNHFSGRVYFVFSEKGVNYVC